MAATLFYLVRNPSALARATEEVRRAFDENNNNSENDDTTTTTTTTKGVEAIRQGPTLTSCAYLRACIDEAMRLSPSVGGIAPREVLPGGLAVDGERVPAGVVVGVPHYTIHHNAAYYPRPFEYVPERWLAAGSGAEKRDENETGGENGEVALAQSAFCPFSIGPRGCIGKGLAYVEMMTAIARTLYLYDLRRAAGLGGRPDPAEGGRPGAEWGRHRVGEFQLVDQFTSLKDGPMVEFRRRGGVK